MLIILPDFIFSPINVKKTVISDLSFLEKVFLLMGYSKKL